MPITASKGSPYARVEGIGAAIPSRVVDNAEMCTYIDSSDEWIQQRTGIIERRWVGEGENVETLSLDAARQAIERAGSTEALAVARALEGADVSLAGQHGRMRAVDHQFQQQLVVGVMDRLGAPGVQFDVEGSGYGFRVVRQISAEQARMPTSCRMVRP